MSRPALARALLLVAVAAAAPACAALTGGAKKDEVEAAREEDAERAARQTEDLEPLTAPELEVGEEGFGESAFGETADLVAEAVVIVAIAAAITAGVHGLLALLRRSA